MLKKHFILLKDGWAASCSSAAQFPAGFYSTGCSGLFLSDWATQCEKIPWGAQKVSVPVCFPGESLP